MMAEYMADLAARASSQAESEAMVGAAVATIISPRDRARLRVILPHLVRGTAILTRILRSRRATRPFVRTASQIASRTVKILRKRAARGKPITRKTAARVMQRQVRKVLGNPRLCAKALGRNVVASRAVARKTSRRRRRRI
jgi:hypothetical protein